MKLLRKALIDGSFLLDLDERDIESIFRCALDYGVTRGVLPAERREEVEAGLLQREQQASTAIGNAVAVPHTYSSAFSKPVILFVRLSHPINLGAPDGVPTRFVFMLLGPTGAEAQHLDTLANIARLMSDDEFRYDAGDARNQLELLAALDRFNTRISPPQAARRETVPQVMAEFEDSALLKVFAQKGVGIFAAPSAIEKEICRQYRVRAIGELPSIQERYYAISMERKLKHPAVVAISDAAREELFA